MSSNLVAALAIGASVGYAPQLFFYKRPGDGKVVCGRIAQSVLRMWPHIPASDAVAFYAESSGRVLHVEKKDIHFTNPDDQSPPGRTVNKGTVHAGGRTPSTPPPPAGGGHLKREGKQVV